MTITGMLVRAALFLMALILLRRAAAGEHPAEPAPHHVDHPVPLPHQSSATLSPGARHALEKAGITYVIPRVPYGYPPVKSQEAVQLAATHSPVGSRPRLREVALIAITGTSVPPLRHGLMCWALRFVIAEHRVRNNSFFAFVDANTGEPLGGVWSS